MPASPQTSSQGSAAWQSCEDFQAWGELATPGEEAGAHLALCSTGDKPTVCVLQWVPAKTVGSG